MTHHYTALPYGSLEGGVTYQRPPQRLKERVHLDSPAIEVMTDLTKVSAMTIGPCANLDAANQRMIAMGVRLLLITDEHNNIAGIITSTDLSSDKPLKYLKEVGGRREDIFVRDIMTAQTKLEVLDIKVVERSRVGDIVATLKSMGRRHALVVDQDEAGRQKVRGIFSARQISTQLGHEIETVEVAKTFAELGAALG